MLFLNIATGVILVLLGMRYIRKGLDRLFGSQVGAAPRTTIVAWVLGANLGITLTMMMAGWGSVEGRRLALGSLLIKGCGVLLILLGGSRFFVFILNLLPGAIDRQAANLNTFFNLILGLASFTLALAYFTCSYVPDRVASNRRFQRAG